MEKKMNNKGFSLVELIIVVAIMAVLIGVLAPAYLQYVEKSKKTSDCTALGSAMDAMEICAADPALDWDDDEITATINADGIEFSGGPSKTTAQLYAIIASDSGKLQGNWSGGSLSVVGTKNSLGQVTFTCTQKDAIAGISPALAGRMGD